MSSRRERVLALSGVFQSAAIVHRIAWHGADTRSDVEASLCSLFAFDAVDTPSVYGGLKGLRTGLEALTAHLGGTATEDDMAVMRYTVGLLHLERRADATPGTWQSLHEGLVGAQRQVETFGLLHQNTIASIAGLYQDLISPIGPRIMVEGESVNLRHDRNAALIRAVLLSGIRAAVLRRQLGASRWSLLFGRARMVDDAHDWLATL